MRAMAQDVTVSGRASRGCVGLFGQYEFSRTIIGAAARDLDSSRPVGAHASIALENAHANRTDPAQAATNGGHGMNVNQWPVRPVVRQKPR